MKDVRELLWRFLASNCERVYFFHKCVNVKKLVCLVTLAVY